MVSERARKAVRLSFNPSNVESVDKIKLRMAEVIDIVQECNCDSKLKDHVIFEIQKASMSAVLAVTEELVK